MIQLNLKSAGDKTLKVLCLGAHSDDIEIGCGGTILRLREQYPQCRVSLGGLQRNRSAGKRSTERPQNCLSALARLARAAVEDLSRQFHAVCRSRREGGLRATEERRISRCRLHSQPQRCASGSSLALGTDGEYVSRSFDSRIRNSEIRRRHGPAQRLRTARNSDGGNKKCASSWMLLNRSAQNVGLRKARFFRSCGCAAWNVMPPSGYAEAFYCRKLVL